MIKTISVILLALALPLLFSCVNQKNEAAKVTSVDKFEQNQSPNRDSLETLDTTITLNNLAVGPNYKGAKLTERLAKRVLYNHFIKKGYFSEDALPKNITERNRDNLVVYYDTIYKLNLSNDKFSDAIITYCLIPPGGSGHCYQPHRAIIANSDNDYEISDEDFIPQSFAIDSTMFDGSQNTILGKVYDCSNNQFTRDFRLVLK